jgi:hypothetical protein
MAMDMSRFTGSNYITADYLKSLGPNVRIEAKIVSVAIRDFDGDGEKPVVYTDYQGKGVVLNPTRAKVLYAAFGPNDDNWVGKTIVIFLGETTYGGKKTGCVEIEAVGAQRIGSEQRRAIRGDNGAPPIDEAPDGPGELDDDISY